MVVKRDMDLYLYFRRRTVGCFLTTAPCRQLRTPTGRLVVLMEGRLSCPTRGCERIYVECERGFSEKEIEIRENTCQLVRSFRRRASSMVHG